MAIFPTKLFFKTFWYGTYVQLSFHNTRNIYYYLFSFSDYHTSNCFYTNWDNSYDGMLTLNVASNNYIRGVVSEYSVIHR